MISKVMMKTKHQNLISLSPRGLTFIEKGHTDGKGPVILVYIVLITYCIKYIATDGYWLLRYVKQFA